MSEFLIQDLSSSHIYRTELPNLIFEIGLHPTLIGIYSALKRCAGDRGNCTKSIKTLCSQLQIAKNTLKGWIKQLCEINPIIKKPLIVLQERNSEHGDSDTHCISITDIWPDNCRYFLDKKWGGSKIDPPRSKIDPGVGQKLTQGGSKIDPYKEQYKKNLYEEQTTSSGFDFVFFDSFLKRLDLPSEKQKKWNLTEKNKETLLKHHSQEKIKLAFEYAESPGIKIKTTLIQILNWHCKQEKPTLTPEKVNIKNQDNTLENKKISLEFLEQCKPLLNEKNYMFNNKSKSLRIVNERTSIPFEISLKEIPHIFKEIVEKTIRDYELWIPKNDTIIEYPKQEIAMEN
jgi:hypothetical protein